MDNARIERYIKERTREKKIVAILLMESMHNDKPLYLYRNELPSSFNGLMNKIGYTRAYNQIFYETKARDILGLSEEQFELRRLMMRLKSEGMYKKRTISNPVVSNKQHLKMSRTEYDDMFINAYLTEKREIYERIFAQIEFNNNPLFDEEISNMLDNRSFLLDSNDIIDNGDIAVQHLEYQREILLKVMDTMYVTGALHTLVDKTWEKQKYLNSFLQNKLNALPIGKVSDSKEDYVKTCLEFLKNQIKELNLEDSVEDRVELVKLSRHYLNKYTKDIEESESRMMEFFINTDSKKELEKQSQIFQEEKKVFDFVMLEDRNQIVEDIILFMTKVPELSTEEFWNMKSNCRFLDEFGRKEDKKKGYITEKYKCSDKKSRDVKIKTILSTKFKINYTEKCNFSVDNKKLNELLIELHNNKDNEEKINELRSEISNCFKANEKEANDTISKITKESTLTCLKRLRNQYESLVAGKANKNKPISFSAFVSMYLEYKDKNIGGPVEDFIALQAGNVKDIDDNKIKMLYKNMESVLAEIDEHDLKVAKKDFIIEMSKYLERKQKVYNLKHLNSIQLYCCKKDMSMGIVNGEEGEDNALDIYFDNYFEVFGGHYKITDPENKLEFVLPVWDSYLSKIYAPNNGTGCVYIPFPKLTKEQKDEFKKLSNFLDMIEHGEEIDSNASDWDKQIYDKLTEIHDKNKKSVEKGDGNSGTNEYASLRIQFAAGAGIERFREVMTNMSYNRTVKNHGNPIVKKYIKRVNEHTNDADKDSNEQIDIEEEVNQQLQAKDERIAELERLLQEERESHSLTKKALVSAQDIIKSVFGFVDKVKSSVFGKFFFGKAIKELPEAKTNDEENFDREER